VGALVGCSDLLKHTRESTNPKKLIDQAWHLSGRLAAEIESHQLLLAAENNELSVRPSTLGVRQLLKEIRTRYESHPAAQGISIALDPGTADVSFTSDKTLLGRVIGNMLKNALEAASSGETVVLGAGRMGDRIRLWVHNPEYMPREAQLQVFQRSFSTKGANRGIGTYSMRLLTERYLGGTVDFTSSPETGTTFTVEYPLSGP
jgi:signal transduction histidine kinase